MIGRLTTAFEQISLRDIEQLQPLLVAAIVFFAGMIVVRIFARLFSRHILKTVRDQSREMIRKAVVYVGAVILIVVALRVAGLEVTALLGAAGVVGIAVGIASQASLSNIISGLFLVSERYFEIGDVVRVNGNVGVIHAIDLLSIKIKTFDNVLVRIPNQQIIETDFVNITRFPIRRQDFSLTLPFELEIDDAFAALSAAAARVPEVLADPEPFIMYTGHTGNGWTVLLGAWFERTDYVAVRNGVAMELQREFRDRGIRVAGNFMRVKLENGPPFDNAETQEYTR